MAIRCGTEGADLIRGGIVDSTISGLGGNDTIYGSSGTIISYGGLGNDVLYGGDSGVTNSLSETKAMTRFRGAPTRQPFRLMKATT